MTIQLLSHFFILKEIRMITFEDFLNEKLITFSGKSYPKENQILILAGGAGSGKGFILNNLIGLEGKVIDVDNIKSLALKSVKLADKIKTELGHDIKTFNLKNKDDVYKLHQILKTELGITDKYQANIFTSVLSAPEDRKPNLIFDVTLEKLSKLYSITMNVESLGYKKENIHIVWIVNDIKIALEQNQSRDRVVPEDIVFETHEGVALTIKKILDMGDKLKEYMDGNIVIAFNKAGVDVKIKKSDKGGKYITDANYIVVKKQRESQISSGDLIKSVYDKIKSYVPKTEVW